VRACVRSERIAGRESCEPSELEKFRDEGNRRDSSHIGHATRMSQFDPGFKAFPPRSIPSEFGHPTGVASNGWNLTFRSPPLSLSLSFFLTRTRYRSPGDPLLDIPEGLGLPWIRDDSGPGNTEIGRGACQGRARSRKKEREG